MQIKREKCVISTSYICNFVCRIYVGINLTFRWFLINCQYYWCFFNSSEQNWNSSKKYAIPNLPLPKCLYIIDSLKVKCKSCLYLSTTLLLLYHYLAPTKLPLYDRFLCTKAVVVYKILERILAFTYEWVMVCRYMMQKFSREFLHYITLNHPSVVI